jgi:hypothetical protein
MSPRFARLLSWILHPSVMPTVFIALFFYYNPITTGMLSFKVKLLVYLTVVFFTFFMPGLTVLAMIRGGYAESLYLRTAEERRIPFLMTSIYYLAAFYVLREIHLPNVFNLVMLGAAMSVLIACLINYYWKISIHMIGIGGVSGAILGLSMYLGRDLALPFTISIFIAGLLGTARLVRHSHSPAQLYAGYMVGFASEFVLLSFA